ncbi:uncharacterized protein LOC144798280 isoform X1 [Lissotriton helveticus]
MPCWQDADLCRRGVIKVHSQESSRPVFLGQREQVHSQESSRPVFLGQREQVHSQESSRPVFLGQREQPIKVWVTSCASLWSNSFHTFRVGWVHRTPFQHHTAVELDVAAPIQLLVALYQSGRRLHGEMDTVETLRWA